jgi:actin
VASKRVCYISTDLDGNNNSSSANVNKQTTKSSATTTSGSEEKSSATYQLPDGQVMTIGNNERCQAAELLFKPSLRYQSTASTTSGSDYKQYNGIHQMIFNSIHKGDSDIRRELYSNIVLSGGNTMFDGIALRLERELKSLLGSSTVSSSTSSSTTTSSSSGSGNGGVGSTILKVFPSDEQNLRAWIGGSIIASLPTFSSMCITRADYDEVGPSIVHRKCF